MRCPSRRKGPLLIDLTVEETDNNYKLRRSLRKWARCRHRERWTETVRKGDSEMVTTWAESWRMRSQEKRLGTPVQAEGIARAKHGAEYLLEDACRGKEFGRCEISWCAWCGAREGSLPQEGWRGRQGANSRWWKCDSSAQESNLGRGYRFGDYLQENKKMIIEVRWAHQGRERGKSSTSIPWRAAFI